MAIIKGTPGPDDIVGGAGADTISGLAGDDVLDGAGGADRIFGGEDDDTLRGGDGNDRLDGGRGDDTVSGESGDDVLHAGPFAPAGPFGGESLSGGTGDDKLFGEDGDDFLAGGEDVDQMTGGAGSDTFEFREVLDDYDSGVGNGNRDAIKDFSSEQGDKIDVSPIDADDSTFALEDFVFVGKAGIGILDTTEIGFVETGGVTIIHSNTGTDAGSSFEIQLGGTGLGLGPDDFIL